LPQMKHGAVGNTSAVPILREEVASIYENSSASKDANINLFEVLQQLLAEKKALNGQSNSSQVLQPSLQHSAHSQVLARSKLLSLLSELQHNPTRIELAQNIDDNGEEHIRFEIKDAVETLVNNPQVSEDVTSKKLIVGKNDDDVMNLVAMLFEFILDDKNLPESVKARIGRLQIPILKVAIIDKSFFSCTTHPARSLLNKLAQSGIGLNDKAEQSRDNLLSKIDEVVQRVLSEFDSDVGLFGVLLAGFNQFVESEERRSRLIEQRIRDAEVGKAKAEIARTEVDKILTEKMKGQSLSSITVSVLHGPWTSYMFLLFLKQGKGSYEWNDAVQIANELVWSVSPKNTREEYQQLIDVMPGLLDRLNMGLDIVSYNPFEKEILFQELKDVHSACAIALENTTLEDTGLQNSDLSYIKKVDVDDPEQALLARLTEDLAMMGVPSINEEAAVALNKALDEELDQTLEVADVFISRDAEREAADVEEIELTVPGIYTESFSTIAPLGNEVAEQNLMSQNDGYIEHVQALEVGSWVEFKAEDNSKVRCKLAAKIKAADKYIFVNRTGVKVAEKTTMGLCVELRRGTVKFLDDALLFDRALEAVIGSLRNTGVNNLQR
ncbi:MAG: DUF1631 domain-containing protein, partial [Pseudomonadales bacterium]|nr:DUF1631 domain-containing protein [Pseudomonadales bacterium]